ncbi:MAG: multidrug effflux MFS transporter [Alphaproteobacteria bacterium]
MLKNTKETSFIEFVALMALLISLTALSIDTMLPALPLIGKDLGAVGDNTPQYIVVFLFLGFTLGQIFYGPMSDSFGRKHSIYIGITIFIIGSIISVTAQNFPIMLAGRFLQGIGVAAPRIISTAMIRDRYKGQEMARVMSFIMSIFILVPAIAPTLGQAILMVSNWRMIFAVLLGVSVLVLIWIYFRLPETLPQERRTPFKLKTILSGVREVITHRLAFGYTICTGLIFAMLIGYLNSAQQIFQEYYNTGDMFPLYFGIIALSLGIASLVNSYIVKIMAMQNICHYSLIAIIIVSGSFLALNSLSDQQQPLWQFMIYAVIVFFFLGLLFGNVNAIAMEHMGHIAGVASTTISVLSSAISLALGTIIGQFYAGTPIPIIFSFLLLSSLTFLLQILINRK